ncbi:MAG: hypothetical protein IAE65_11400 [Ignavibacteria bacterium]|nr:hypothetical protein [Ignavibacteria bacterium]
MKKLILTLALVLTSIFGLTSTSSFAAEMTASKVNQVTAPTEDCIVVFRQCGSQLLKFTYDLDMRLVKVERVED